MKTALSLRVCSHGSWVRCAARKQSQIAPDEFLFLGERKSLSVIGWDSADVSKLWRYNLHYFDDLNACAADGRRAWHLTLIERWLREVPAGKGTGWEAYPVSIRIVNWIKWVRGGGRLSENALQSLAVQARWLTRNLEWHLLGNHLFSNAKALIFAGCFFSGKEADAWLRLGMEVLEKEIPEQILPDGANFELSTMYHSLMLEDMLDLVNILRSEGFSVPEGWSARIAAMRKWLAAMSHPDGEIAFFNDSAIGIAPSPQELENYAIRLGFEPFPAKVVPCQWLPESGYIRLQNEYASALLDVARVGPDYLPGHAHADTLSFELAVGRNRVIVNSGTSIYSEGPLRLRQRGTAAHNTVEIDGYDSSEVWASFRVARRAFPIGLSIDQTEAAWVVNCGHSGYSWLPGAPQHWRTWHFSSDSLVVSDRVEGFHKNAVAVFHFAPDCRVRFLSEGERGEIMIGETVALRWVLRAGIASLHDSVWYPEFGVSIPSKKLVIGLQAGYSSIEFLWKSGDACTIPE